MLIDTHTHLYLDEFLPDKREAVNRAFSAGVGKLLFPNVDLSTVGQMKALHADFPDRTFMAMGLHPTEVNDSWTTALAEIESELKTNRQDYVAVGEIGIDLYWDKTFAREQAEVFKRQCEWAVEYDIPVIIHCREGLDLTLEILDSLEKKPRGVFHSFGGTPEDVAKVRRCGDFYFGINGIVTFKNAALQPTVEAIGLDRIVLETDSPYLAPVPYRGKRNESAYIINIANKIAEIMNLPLDVVEAKTTANAETLFSI